MTPIRVMLVIVVIRGRRLNETITINWVRGHYLELQTIVINSKSDKSGHSEVIRMIELNVIVNGATWVIIT